MRELGYTSCIHSVSLCFHVVAKTPRMTFLGALSMVANILSSIPPILLIMTFCIILVNHKIFCNVIFYSQTMLKWCNYFTLYHVYCKTLILLNHKIYCNVRFCHKKFSSTIIISPCTMFNLWLRNMFF